MNRSLSGLLLGAVIAIIAVITWWSRGDRLVVDRPEWMQQPTSSTANAKEKPVIERVELKSREDSPISDMAPPENISDALKAAGQKVQFEASALLSSELATEVAEEMVAAAEAHWLMYQSAIFLKQDDTITRDMDFLFSAWPDISQLIADKKVEVVVLPAPNRGAIQGPGSISYAYGVVEDMLTAAFHLPSWRVRIVFTDSTYQPELRKRIADSAAKDVSDARTRRNQNK